MSSTNRSAVASVCALVDSSELTRFAIGSGDGSVCSEVGSGTTTIDGPL